VDLGASLWQRVEPIVTHYPGPFVLVGVSRGGLVSLDHGARIAEEHGKVASVLALSAPVAAPVHIPRVIAGISGFVESLEGLAQALPGVVRAVRRDLEWLLNTRRTPIAVPSSLPETTRSVFNYGLPDLTSFSYEGGDDRARLLRGVEDIVALFEPRLAGARVAMVETTGEGTHQKELRFVIEGTLRVEPTPERVAFDTVIEMGSGECRVGDRRVDTTNG
jgi:type VI secretion system protein ImpF